MSQINDCMRIGRKRHGFVNDDSGLNMNILDPDLPAERFLNLIWVAAAQTCMGRRYSVNGSDKYPCHDSMPLVKTYLDFMFDVACHPIVPKLVFHELKKDGEKSPGPDGLKVTQVDEQWAKSVHDQLKRGTYVPGPVKYSFIPKDRGNRQIKINTLADKFIEKGVNMVLAPLVGENLSTGHLNVGCSNGAGVHDLLADLQKSHKENKFGCFLKTDIESAFDMIQHSKLAAVIKRNIPDTRMERLLMMNVKRTNVPANLGGSPKIGIGQGQPLSSTLLNFFLHELLDVPLICYLVADIISAKIYRYADDIGALLPNKKEARKLLNLIEKYLNLAGLRINTKPHKTKIVDLQSGDEIEYLGFRILKSKHKLVYKLPNNFFSDLKTKVLQFKRECHSRGIKSDDEFILSLRDQIGGRFNHYGPCFDNEKVASTVNRAASIVNYTAGREVVTEKLLRRDWRHGADSWNRIRQGDCVLWP